MQCYAVNQAHRNAAMGQPVYEGLTARHSNGMMDWTGVVRTLPERLVVPFRWKRPRRVFVDSMSDLFHEGVPEEFIDEVFTVMAQTPQHTYQVLTKRPERMARYMAGWLRRQDGNESPPGTVKPLPNVWLGTSVENQETADERIPWLVKTRAAVLFLSCEPLLGPLDLERWLPIYKAKDSPGVPWSRSAPVPDMPEHGIAPLGWVIVGGESGPHSRPFNLAWARSIVDQCRAAGVPVFVKQLGAKPVESGQQCAGCTDPRSESTHALGTVQHGPGALTLRHSKGGAPEEWPAELRVREFPATAPVMA